MAKRADIGGTAGRTVGVEEEFHLVDARTYALANRPELSAAAAARTAGPHLQAEMLASQLETATDVCTGLEELRRAVVQTRREAAAAAAAHGARILAASTHPTALLAETAVLPWPRYAVLVTRFGSVVRAFNLTGCHVHVGVPDLDTAVRIMTHARPYLPVLAALTGSSPFHEGIDTGWQSFRLAQLALWPQGGTPPALSGADAYLELVNRTRALGMIDDATNLLWDVRPSARFPTLEFRIADVCTDVDDVVLYAGLVRALVRTLAARVAAGRPAAEPIDTVLRAARWRAARFGVHDTLWSVSRDEVVPAAIAIEDLWDELVDDLREHDEHDEQTMLRDRLDKLLERGTSASRQRRIHRDTGDFTAVLRDAVELTNA